MVELHDDCGSPYRYARRPAREVRAGRVGIGSDHPVRVQSMTVHPTRDVEETAREIAGLERAGCDIVRLTVATGADAAALPAIRERLEALGVRVPLVADIHFSPSIALRAVRHVEKVRVNPGNYVDRKAIGSPEISDEEFEAARRRVEEALVPLIRAARERGVSMRIGVNHGSLSERMLQRHGDTPAGMVESALEFVRICEREGFRDLVLSMKSSNPVVMIHANRLLAARMRAEAMDYPIHLGVTEAGEGRPGRVKSAVGIGSLLEDGIGDTVRVSLTEDAAQEVPVARALARRVPADDPPAGPRDPQLPARPPHDPFSYRRRPSRCVRVGRFGVGGGEPPRVEASFGPWGEGAPPLGSWLDRFPAGEGRAPEIVEIDVADRGALRDLLDRGPWGAPPAPGGGRGEWGGRPGISLRLVAGVGAGGCDRAGVAALADRIALPLEGRGPSEFEAWGRAASRGDAAVLVEAPPLAPGRQDAWRNGIVGALGALADAGLRRLLVGIPLATRPPGAAPVRLAASFLAAPGLDVPLVLLDPGAGDPILDPSVRLGSALCDGYGDAVRIQRPADPLGAVALAWEVLQAARARVSRAEFISCPSCGRTLFDLEATSRRVRRRTGHLVGVKIAVMGCLVNGPGEMADADFGYVGWKPGKVNLYVGRECVLEGVPEGEAGERLVELIKERGRWIDPPAGAEAGARGSGPGMDGREGG